MTGEDEGREKLRFMLKEAVGSNPFSDLFGVTMSAKGCDLCGKAVLSALGIALYGMLRPKTG